MPPYSYNSSNQLTTTPSATFAYDANGNTSTKVDASGTTTYNWDFENRLTSVTLPGAGGTVSFRYDPFGRRIQKSSLSGTTNYLYDSSSSVEELDQNGATLAHYAQGEGTDEPLAELHSGAMGFYEEDGLGSVTSLTDSTAAVLNSYSYDAFGNTSASAGSFVNPYRYTGRDYDPETGLLYYRSRYYDSQAGRFLTEDPIGLGGGINFYAYAGNDPADLTDPFGLCPPDKCPDKEERLAKMKWLIEAVRGNKKIEFKGLAQRFSQYLGSKPGVGYADSNHVDEYYKLQNQIKDLIKDYINSGCGDPPDSIKDWSTRQLPELTPKPNSNPNSNSLVDWYWKHYPFTGPFWDGVRDWQNDVERRSFVALNLFQVGWELPAPHPILCLGGNGDN
jgi:RHS repeat-associated protein